MLASHRQKRNPRPSAWLSLHLRSPVPGCVVFLVVFLEESSWDMAWVASPVPANSPVILDGCTPGCLWSLSHCPFAFWLDAEEQHCSPCQKLSLELTGHARVQRGACVVD